MSLNDKDIGIGGNKGVDIHPGVANPTAHSNNANPLDTNFVTDPTSGDFGAGAGANFQGHKQAARGFAQTHDVIEGRPGVIESTHIDPLDENQSNKDDGWANATKNPGSTTATSGGLMENATTMAKGAAQMAYGTVAGDVDKQKTGKEAMFGKQ